VRTGKIAATRLGVRGIAAVSVLSFVDRSAVLLLASWLALAAGIEVAPAEEVQQRVLMLHSQNALTPATVTAGEAAKRRLTSQTRVRLDVYSEFLDFARFAGADHEARTARHLAEKYSDRKPALIMAIGPQSLQFANRNRTSPVFDAPIVFCCTSRARLDGLVPAAAPVTGIISEFDLAKTLSLAQRLQPDARNLVVISGATEFDRQWGQIARRHLGPYEQRYDTKYWEALRHEDLIDRLKSIPRDTIVILLTVFADGAGRFFVPRDVARELASVSAAPVYAPYESQLGTGIVGGHMDSFEQVGNEVAELAISILAGTVPSTTPPQVTGGSADRVDWRQLRRWSMSEALLPSGTDVHFREPSLWERYRWQIVAIAILILTQAAALTWMYIERHRRQALQAALQQRLMEVIHLNRVATASALSASVAHELNQPLAAIQSYAEAAELYLKAAPPNIERVTEILADIRNDDQRAADIINHFRGLLKKSEALEMRELDVNDVVRSTLRIIDSEALKRGVSLSASHADGSLPVLADQVHLEQVILNLAVNGMDAMQDCTAGTGKMSIETALVSDLEVEVSVADSGTGIPADKLNTIFDTFYTTKRLGTGLGLSIARTIVETYGGRIWAENRPGGGAAFRFTLPLSKGVPA
jgi:signal transduction histidine kinase